MNDVAKQLSHTIESVARALAEWTVNRHVESDPALPRRYGDTWRKDWTGNVRSRLAYLAQAVAVRRPALFTQMMQWSASAARAREVQPDDLVSSLDHMREILAQELPAPVARTAAEYVEHALASLRNGSNGSGDSLGTRSHDHKLMLQYLEAVLASDLNAAHGLIIEHAEAGVPVIQLYDQVVQPAMSMIGEMWHRGEITVADEHFATACTQSLLGVLRSYFKKTSPRAATVVTAGVSGDFHDVGLRMIADCFEMDGWRALSLGANMPAKDIVDFLNRLPADLLALSVSTSLFVRQAGELIEAVRVARPASDLKIIVGGSPFDLVPDLWEEIGADGCAHNATDAVALGNQLVGGS